MERVPPALAGLFLFAERDQYILAFAKDSRCDLADMPFSGLRFASCSMVASTTVAVAGTRRITIVAQGTDLDLARETVAAAGKCPDARMASDQLRAPCQRALKGQWIAAPL
jgi:hypothetical protein